MKRKQMNNSSKSFSQITYQRFAMNLINLAKPISSDIVLSGAQVLSDLNSFYDISHSLSCVSFDLLRKGKTRKEMILIDDENGCLSFGILNQNGVKRLSDRDVVAHQMLKLSVTELGIKPRKIKHLYSCLCHSFTFDDSVEFDPVKHLENEKVSNEILDRAGRIIPWEVSPDDSFTSANRMLCRCDQIILGIKLCSLIENKINMFFRSCGHSQITLTIPVYSLEEYEQSRRLFILGKKTEREFLDLVYRTDLTE